MRGHNDLTFFTNEPERNLYERFNKILRSNTQFFDILVGYFRTSGFYMMYPALTDVEKIRILVGLNVDSKTVEMIQEANEQLTFEMLSHQKASEKFSEAVEDEFGRSEDTYATEKSVEIFIDWLKSGKLEMRMYVEAPIHAKVYIMRKDMEKVPDQFGSVITGSSNFSMAGLKNNLEFNVELKDSRDVDFALEKFEELWAKGVDISETYIETIQEKTWLRDNILPYELYLKTLYEFFKEEINEDKNELKVGELPPEFMELQYQRDAVRQAMRIIDKYNGVFLSDVVGLGKTFIAALLAQQLMKKGRILVICPPTLVDYWNDVLKDFFVIADVVSLGKLEYLLQKGVSKYQYVFIDEAHRFRNEDTQSFSALHEICFGKKVVLISATPQNNYATDICNQIYIFQPKHNCTIIPETKNIEVFFKKLEAKLNKVKNQPSLYQQQLRENSEIIRDKVLRNIMVRRTRREIMDIYGDDLKQQGLVFPKVAPPEKIVYSFDDKIEEVFNKTIGVIKGLKYARYTPLLFHKNQKKYATLIVSQHNMSGFMKSMLVKRLESSFYAFKKTLNRFIESHEKFIAMCETGTVYISKKVNVYDLMDSGDDEKLLRFIDEDKVQKFKIDDFSPSFLAQVKCDLAMLQELQGDWNEINTDPKVEQFISQINTNKILKNKKLIIFTESKETAEYVGQKLEEQYPQKVAVFSSQGTPMQKLEIQKNFDPRVDDEEQKNNIRLLVTTDVLAEGINLHRANIIINYDLPWNPTRIMQRVGRVNRVGSKYDSIYVFNFFPTSQAKKHLSLEDNIKFKLQAFHDTLGEDLKYLSDAEEISSHSLYEILNSSEGLEGNEESINPELTYLKEIRKLRDDEPKLFEKIKRIPLKAKTARKEGALQDATLSFIRKDAGKYFFLTSESKTLELNFTDAVHYLKATQDEKAFATCEAYYIQLKMNKDAFDNRLKEEDTVIYETVGKVTGNDKKIRDLLMALSMQVVLTDIEEVKVHKVIALIEEGKLPKNTSKQIVQAMKVKEETDPLKLYHLIMEYIPNRYLGEQQEKEQHTTQGRQVILSEYFYGEGID